MTKFKRHARYDATQANDGVWFYVEDELGNEHGGFKCAFVEPGSPRWVAAHERLQAEKKSKTVGNGFRQPTKPDKKEQARQNDKELIRNFIEISLLDWIGIEDEKGKPVPFTKAEAIDYFDVDDSTALYVFKYIFQHACDVVNYQPDEQTELPEGN